jgi:nucleotide-binding universal stress UspA family protein
VELAQATGSRLIVTSVAYVPKELSAPELLGRFQEWEREESERAASVAKEIAAEIARPGVSVETITSAGPPAATLADLAQKGNVDLVVVGHRGRGALARALMGSVADRLVQICTKPVLVVR